MSRRVRATSGRSLTGHPRGLWVLLFTEGCIGFASYGVQSLLVLYLASQALQPGHIGQVLGLGGLTLATPADRAALASAIAGLYAASIYATPILAGLLADRLLGRTRTVLLGATLLSLGLALLSGSEAGVLPALALAAVGLGCTGCLKAQVAALYVPDDPRRQDAFQLLTLAVALGRILRPAGFSP